MGSPIGGDDSHDVLVTFGPNNENQASLDGTDSDESVFVIRMSVIKKLEIVRAGAKELAGFFERDAVLLLVETVLGTVPCDPHRDSVSQWRTASTA